MAHQTKQDLTHFLSSAGEMGELVASKDWSNNPLGPIKSWPQSLQTTISLCIASNFPIAIIWGQSHIQIYNDGYRVICAEKHPGSMGQDFTECWALAWPVIGAAFDAALNGKASYLEDAQIFLDRRGYLEETFFTFSFSPIRDETGGICGLFHPVTEQTVRMLSERRTRAIRDLTAGTAHATSVDAVLREAARALSPYSFDLPYVLVYRLDTSGFSANLTGSCGVDANSPLCPTTIAFGEPGPWQLSSASLSSPITKMDLYETFHVVPSGPYEEPTTRAFLIPLASPGMGSAGAFLIAGISTRLPLDDQYRDFFTMLGATVGAAMAKAHALQESENRALALAQLDRAKSAFFSNVSHELRTPLTLLLGPLEDLLADAEPPLHDGHRKHLELAHRNAKRLLKLVNTLLDFSRIEADRVDGSFEPVDIGSMTTRVASQSHAACEKAGLELRIDCPPSVVPVYVDPDMWEKITLNLVSNALKYTFDGAITVSLLIEDERARLHVSDSGVGIAEHELPKVFERFHRIEGQKGRTHEGTGIGLALVAELVKLHGGEIAVASEIGRGTQFTVTLPLGHAHLPGDRVRAPGQNGQSDSASHAATITDEALGWMPAFPEESKSQSVENGYTQAVRARVILADDNQDMRTYIQRILENAGYQVEPVANGVEAIRAATSGNAVDLVLTDVMMPELDGFDVLRAIRENADTRSMLVILVSARAGEEARAEGLEAGADDYIVKPFGARELLARIDSAIRLARDRRDAVARESELKSEIQAERSRAAQLESEAKLQFALEAGRLAKQAEVDIRHLNAELDQRVVQRTAQLEASNRELEAFTYSVSHDLRAPLRGVDSFSRMVIEDYGPQLDDEGRRLLNVVRDEAQRMGRLIDDLLDFARVGRKEMRLQSIDMSALVQGVIDNFGVSPARRQDIKVAPLPDAYGDQNLLQQVWVNLISNALKFTSHRQAPVIEICASSAEDFCTYEIKDNGAGFDPRYLHKLFGVFQRLHTDEEFEGTGVGLALVQRIVHRHGGSVRGEGEIDKGATFYFSLPVPEEQNS